MSRTIKVDGISLTSPMAVLNGRTGREIMRRTNGEVRVRLTFPLNPADVQAAKVDRLSLLTLDATGYEVDVLDRYLDPVVEVERDTVAQQNYRKALGAAARSEIRSLVRHEVEGPWAEVLKVYTTDELGRVVPSKAVTAEDARAWVHTWDARDAFAYLVHA